MRIYASKTGLLAWFISRPYLVQS